MSRTPESVLVRNTRPEDFPDIIDMSRRVYPDSVPWKEGQLASHLKMFPEGQHVAIDAAGGRVLGMAASLIIVWDDYDMGASWRDFTDHGMFTNHDPDRGHTLYGAEIMVDPDFQGRGIGTLIYGAREQLARRLRRLRIRAGARLRGYSRYADRLTAEEYAVEVAHGRIWDPTVSFQLRRGFHILAVVPEYLRHDSESLGHAAIIEWLNPEVARPEDEAGRDPRFIPK